MTISIKAIIPFFMGAFFSLMLTERYDSLILGVGFLAVVTIVSYVLNRVITKSDLTKS
ncbi:hypothetical protein QP786_00440 [Gleimia europaea]|nr:hypothetical protein [Gleimia europaea]